MFSQLNERNRAFLWLEQVHRSLQKVRKTLNTSWRKLVGKFLSRSEPLLLSCPVFLTNAFETYLTDISRWIFVSLMHLQRVVCWVNLFSKLEIPMEMNGRNVNVVYQRDSRVYPCLITNFNGRIFIRAIWEHIWTHTFIRVFNILLLFAIIQVVK